MCNPSRLLSPAALFLSGLCAAWCATAIPVTSLPSDTPATFKPVTDSFDYVKREEMIPMRDGVKLKTFILVPKGATHAPILMTRTPYNAATTTTRNRSQTITEILPIVDADFVNDGYIRVYQDVRGMDRSEGE